MLLAKLKNNVDFSFYVNPFETEIISCDYFGIEIVNYQLRGKTLSIQVKFCNAKPRTEDDSLYQERPIKFNLIKIFSLELVAEEFASWGEDDTTLLQVVASKYGIEIDSFEEIENFG